MHMKQYLLSTFFIAAKELEAAMVSLINYSSSLLHISLHSSKCLSFALRSALARRNSSFTADAIRESERDKETDEDVFTHRGSSLPPSFRIARRSNQH